MEAETTGIVISSGAVGAICGVVGTWLKSKVGTKIKRPLDSDDTYVTHQECKEHRCALEKRIDEIGPALNRIFTKLTDIDRSSEERAIKLHERIGPIAERVAADNAKIDTIGKVVEAALARSTVGGKK